MKPLDPRLLRYAKAARGYILLTTAAGILTAGLVIAQVILVAKALAPAVDGTASWQDVSGTVFTLLLIFAARVVVHVVQERFAHRAATRVITELRGQVLGHAVARGPRQLDAAGSAELVTLATRGLDDLAPYFVRYLPQLLLAATLTPATLLVLTISDFTSGLILAFALPLIPIFMWLVGVLTQEYASKRLAQMDRLGGQLIDLLAGLATLKALGRERGPGARVRQLTDAYNRTTMQTLRVAFLSGAILEFIATISVALVAVTAGMRLAFGQLPLQAALIAIMLAPEVLLPLRQVGTHYHAAADGIAAAEATFALLEEPLPANGTLPCPDLRSTAIVFDGVSQVAPGRDTLAPANLTARIEPGQVTALKGPSGAGKSTSALLLLGLLEADRGAITLEPSSVAAALPPSQTDRASLPLADIDRASLHQQISWVPQRPTLLPGTLLENVLGEFSGEATLCEKVESAARSAGFSRVVAQLPHGWDTRIGHGGVGLSVGQRQRLALTRAFIEATPLIVLDEPTAHLDAATEEEIGQAVQELARAGRTVVVIAHRPGVLAAAHTTIEVASQTLQSTAGGAQ